MKPNLYICHTAYQVLVDLLRAGRCACENGPHTMVLSASVPDTAALAARLDAAGVVKTVIVDETKWPGTVTGPFAHQRAARAFEKLCGWKFDRAAYENVYDCTLGTDEYFDYDTSLNAYYENYGADYFMANVKSIFSKDDLTIANFEGTLTESTEREDKQFAFKAPASYANILTAGSVEAVNTANNHSHDYGEESFNDTLKALDTANILHFGYDETAVTEVKGVKVGLVGIYELNDHLGREEQLKQNIAKVKQDGAQLIVVIFHWGNEKEEVPDENQKTLGHLAIDEGADLVCGHHPHVLQGIEEYKGKNIVYSLGNFCFGGNAYPSDMDTIIFQQTFTIDQNGVKDDNVTNIIPCSISSDSDYNNYQPTPAEGEEATRIMQKIQKRSSWIKDGTVSDSETATESDEEYDENSDAFTDSDDTEDPEA